MSASTKMSKSDRATSVKAAQNSWQRLWTAVTPSLSGNNQCEYDEDCKEDDDEITSP